MKITKKISPELKEKLLKLKQDLLDAKVTVGCCTYYPTHLKEYTLALHVESKLSLHMFSKEIGMWSRTMKSWRELLGYPKPYSPTPNDNKKSNFSFGGMTKGHHRALKKIRNKDRYDMMKLKSQQKTEIKVRKPKLELSDETKAYIFKSIDKKIKPIIGKGDVISKKDRSMQEEWLAKNKPKKYIGGELVNE